jgi:hypothetical protein
VNDKPKPPAPPKPRQDRLAAALKRNIARRKAAQQAEKPKD